MGARAWLVVAGIVRSWYNLWRWCLLVAWMVLLGGELSLAETINFLGAKTDGNHL